MLHSVMLIFRRGYIHIEVNYQRSFDYGIGTRDPGHVPNGKKGPGCTVWKDTVVELLRGRAVSEDYERL